MVIQVFKRFLIISFACKSVSETTSHTSSLKQVKFLKFPKEFKVGVKFFMYSEE